MTTKTPDPFPNNWDRINRTPPHQFVNNVTFRDMMIRSSAWDLPESVAGIVRIENENGTITEKVMNNTRSLYKLVHTLETQGARFVAYDNETMYGNIVPPSQD
jgi:hypothetical protein